MSTPFVHLHNHSEFSLLDGASKIKEMVKYAVEMEMPALALTDHGVMYGSFEFYTAARAAGIKPLIGSELYVATRGRKDRDPKRDGNHHLVAIAKNEMGYKNLMKLVTLASLEGFYYKPRVDKELLAEYSEGLIICSACMGGELAQAIMKQSYEDAKNVAAWYREVFKDDFYLEVQGHHANGQWDVNADVKRISREMGIKMVATNDSHYLKAEDADPHDVLICIQTGTTVNDPKRMRYEPREFYLKTYAEMMGEFEHFAPDAIENTLEVAEKVNFEIEVGRAPMPVVGVDPGSDAQTTITRMCWEGLERRLPKNEMEHKERLSYELDIIEKTGFAQYFLIVRDIAQHARQSGIFFGVRGSAAGSLASYCLGITDLDPIEYNLTFERFLNPERVQMPDIDMDFEDTRRAEVIEHVTQQYGKDNVSYITTFGTLGAKAALRDAGRALAMPLPDVDRIARMIPALPLGISITRAMHGWPEKDYPGNPEMVAAYESEELAHKLIDTAKRIEGITRNESVHAAGVMIADRPLVEYTPLRKLNDGSLATQYPHSSLEAIGLLKMDFLGLVNLSILSRAVKLIQQTRGETVDVWDIPLHYEEPRAKKAYDMLGRGETTGVFQLESSGMRKYIVELKPNSVKELSAMVALYRPGPLAHIPRFIQSKFDPDKIEYEHALLEPILKETYGVIVYQDQVLKIVQAVGGLSLGQADLLRRAMGKKQKSYMDKQKGIFMEGAKERGVSNKSAEKIFADIEPFAGYAFNGCLHSKTYIYLPDGSRIHISRAFEIQPTEILSMWEDGVIRPHTVSKIVKTGRKPLFEIRTQGGRVVKATQEHRFLTTEGYQKVAELAVGSELMVQPRKITERQREARRQTMQHFVQTPEQRTHTSKRMRAYQASRSLEEKVMHMQRVHALHPEIRQNIAKLSPVAIARQKWLHENDPEWRKNLLQKSLANVRAAYDTGPGYGHCSIASNGMWCASTPERAMCEWLIEQHISFEMHKVLPNGRMCDFYFGGIYWEMDGMDRVDSYFAMKYNELPYIVVTPEDFRTMIARHLQLDHAENGDPIISILPCGIGETYDIEMAEGGPKNFIANRIVSHNSHAACYAMVAYQTAYMKANYTAEYLAALMAAYVDKTEKVVNTLEECERLGIEILPPDVNESDADFTVREPTDKKKYQGAIRFGLLAIKNIGKSPIETILQARAKGGKFISLPDFCTRVFAEGLTSKSVIEMLIKAGTFKSIHPNRRALMETLDDAVAAAARGAKDAKAGLISLWGDDAGDDAASVESVQPLPNVPDHPRGVWLGWEKELLGLYLTEHPVKPFEPELRRKWRAWRADQISESTPNQQVTVGGMITEVRTKYTKTGSAMLFVTLEDTTGSVSVTLFPKCAAEWGKYCIVNSVVAIIGRAQHRERILKNEVPEEGAEPAAADKNVQIELIADKIERIVENAMAADARPRTVHVRIDPNNRTLLHMVKEMFTSKDGGSPLVVHAETPSGEYLIKTPILVDPDEGLIEQIRRMLGGGHQKAWVE